MKVLKLSEEHNQITIITGNMHFYLLTEINRQRSKILTDYRQSNWVLADNRKVDSPIQTLLTVITMQIELLLHSDSLQEILLLL